MNDRVIAVDVKGTTAPPPNSSATTGQGARRASVAGSPSAPSPISVRERAASKASQTDEMVAIEVFPRSSSKGRSNCFSVE